MLYSELGSQWFTGISPATPDLLGTLPKSPFPQGKCRKPQRTEDSSWCLAAAVAQHLIAIIRASFCPVSAAACGTTIQSVEWLKMVSSMTIRGPLCVAQADLELDGDLPTSCVTMLSSWHGSWHSFSVPVATTAQ